MWEIIKTIIFSVAIMTLWNSCSPAHADVRIVYLNKCADINPVAPDWTCLNETQAAQHGETLYQVAMAVKNARFTKDLVIYSIDPIYVPEEEAYHFGVRVLRGRLYFAAMPGCYQARVSLQRELKRRMRAE